MKRQLPVDQNEKPANRFWALPIVIIIFDQFTKLIARAVDKNIVKNTGTIFGLFAHNQLLVLFITIAIIVFLIYFFVLKIDDADKKRMVTFATMLVIGGGVSNILDRLFHGFITDFIALPFWPAFNFADLSITIGITLLLWYNLTGPAAGRKPDLQIATRDRMLGNKVENI